MNKRNAILLNAVAATALLTGQAQAADLLWTGAGADSDWFTPNNWDAVTIPAEGDLARVSGSTDFVSFSSGTNANLNALRLDNGTMDISGGMFMARKTAPWDTWIANNAGVSVLNQSGGTVEIGFIEIGGRSGGDGTYNLTGGDLAITYNSRKGGYNTFIGCNDGGAGGVGVFEISGDAALSTRFGVYVGWPGGVATNGTFSVIGSGASVDIGNYDTNSLAGNFYLSEGNTLKLGIDSGGISPVTVHGGDATLSYESLIEPYFTGATETNLWTVLTTDGNLADGGVIFAAGVDTNLWNMGVTNGNELWVSYGLGGWNPDDSGVIPPPDPGRELFFTGLGSNTNDALEGSNWVYNAAPAVWGPYDDDILNIGDYNYVGATNSVCIFTENNTNAAGEDMINQNWLNIGSGGRGTFVMQGGALKFRNQSTWGMRSGGGRAYVMVDGGDLTIKSIRAGLNGAKTEISVSDGSLVLTGASSYSGYTNSVSGLAQNQSMAMGIGGGPGSANVNTFTISGGAFTTRAGITMGMSGASAGTPSEFTVEGSAASEIRIGPNNDDDGFFALMSNGVLRATVDAGGVTPILVNTSARGELFFDNGTLLDVSWVAGVTNYGTFDLMIGQGSVADHGLAFADSVDTNLWSFEFVDSTGSGTNDTLRVTAYGETSNGTSIPWLNSYGLTEADDEVDNDGDGLLTWQEYVAGTVPTNGASVLAVTSGENISGNDFVITWQSVEGKSYSIITNDNLVFPEPGVEASGIIGLASETSYTGTVGGASAVFYEIGVQ